MPNTINLATPEYLKSFYNIKGKNLFFILNNVKDEDWDSGVINEFFNKIEEMGICRPCVSISKKGVPLDIEYGPVRGRYSYFSFWNNEYHSLNELAELLKDTDITISGFVGDFKTN